MFQKLVAIEPVSLVLSAEKALYSFADEVVMYSDIPAGDNEIIAGWKQRTFWQYIGKWTGGSRKL